jgi:hypothetical protein
MKYHDQRLDQMQLKDLAELCRKLAELPGAKPAETHAAGTLYQEWLACEANVPASEESPQLRHNIVYFLSGALPRYLNAME